MAGPNPSERGVSQKVEIKMANQVTAAELRELGGDKTKEDWFRRERLLIDFIAVDVRITLAPPDAGPMRPRTISIRDFLVMSVGEMAVVKEVNSITFVGPIRENSYGRSIVEGVKLSPGEVSIFRTSVDNADINVLNAAELATRNLRAQKLEPVKL